MVKNAVSEVSARIATLDGNAEEMTPQKIIFLVFAASFSEDRVPWSGREKTIDGLFFRYNTVSS